MKQYREKTAAILEGRLAPHPQASEEAPAGGDKFSAVQKAAGVSLAPDANDRKQQKTWLMTAYTDEEGKFAGGGKTADTPAALASEVPATDGAVFSRTSGTQNITNPRPEGKIEDYSESRATLPVSKAAVREITSPESPEIAKLLGKELPKGGKVTITRQPTA